MVVASQLSPKLLMTAAGKLCGSVPPVVPKAVIDSSWQAVVVVSQLSPKLLMTAAGKRCGNVSQLYPKLLMTAVGKLWW